MPLYKNIYTHLSKNELVLTLTLDKCFKIVAAHVYDQLPRFTTNSPQDTITAKKQMCIAIIKKHFKPNLTHDETLPIVSLNEISLLTQRREFLLSLLSEFQFHGLDYWLDASIIQNFTSLAVSYFNIALTNRTLLPITYDKESLKAHLDRLKLNMKSFIFSHFQPAIDIKDFTDIFALNTKNK
jgi:hypothetical protein